MRSTDQFAGVDRSLQRAWIKGAGFTDEELAQPLVLIANTYQDFSPENAHLRQVVDAVKAGVRMGGGTPLEFNTFHVTDSEAFAARSMRYVLPSRDVVADSIELMAEGHGVDGLVLLTGGDKPTPGMVMAAARLDLPSILLYAGPTVHGMHRGKKLFLETVYDGVGEVVRGELDEATLRAWEDNLFPGPGAGATLTSGNTAGIYCEALGLSLPGSGTLAAGTNFQLRAAKYTGMRAVDLIREDVRPSQILTRAAFENALRVSLAVSGSTNLVLHFIAMAKEAGIKIDFDFIDKIGRTTPTLAKLAPSGPWGVTELGDAGGVPAVLKRARRPGRRVDHHGLREDHGRDRRRGREPEPRPPAQPQRAARAGGRHLHPARFARPRRRRREGVGRGPVDVEVHRHGSRLRGRGVGDRGHPRRLGPGRHGDHHPQRGAARRTGDARDAGRHVGGGRHGPLGDGRPHHRRPLLRRHARTRDRLRRARGEGRRPDRVRRGRRPDRHRPRRATARPRRTRGRAGRASRQARRRGRPRSRGATSPSTPSTSRPPARAP